MFDRHAQNLIDKLPEIGGLTPEECRRALSRTYLVIVNNRILTNATADWDEDQAELQQTLRRMVNALESVAVFDVVNGVQVAGDSLEASAFVAAEALALFARLVERGDSGASVDDPIQDQYSYAVAESALLYMIGGYDINATAAFVTAREPAAPLLEDDERGNRCRSGRWLWMRVSAFCSGRIAALTVPAVEVRPVEDGPVVLGQLMEKTRRALYDAISEGLELHFAWLRGDPHATLERAVVQLTRVRDACVAQSHGELPRVSGFSDIYHLTSLLLSAVKATGSRTVVHGVPPPEGLDNDAQQRFASYLRGRALGTERLRGRPLLWPSTSEFVKSCLPGPGRDAVVSMPTGSGKSFLAELAVAHALHRGWVLYLAPTNALAHQIRRDLQLALEPFEDVAVSAFVGGAEYTALSDEELQDGKLVAVMTPEKCALALRLYPEMFQRCALCVFDECHLLNDGGRGAVADVLLAQLFHAAPQMRLLMMSALVANADELAEWLRVTRPTVGLAPAASRILWRPSRAARGFVFVDSQAHNAARAAGRAEIAAAPPRRALTVSKEVPLAWVAGLSGPWTRDGHADYRAAPLPIATNFEVSRNRAGQINEGFESWKNGTGLAVAQLLASRGMAAINFVLSSRHHAFSNADRVEAVMPDAVGAGGLPPLVAAQLTIADAELGVPTVLRPLLERGVAVHSSAMLQVEQAASEWMFARGKAKLMIATGTLAQGLNLPAAAVVVSGSQLPGSQPQDFDAVAGLTRANELILNGFGRAGRPGFSNQGVVILVSDKPIPAPLSTAFDGVRFLSQYPVLGEPDASIVVQSPIERFLDQLMAVEGGGDASALEVALTALLSTVEDQGENAATVLRRTFGGFRRRATFTDARAELARQRISQIREKFLQAPGVPAWMPQAAMKAGVEFLHAQRMWEAYQVRGVVSRDLLATVDVRGWFNILIEVLSHMPVQRVMGYLDGKVTTTDRATKTPRTRLAELLSGSVALPDTVPWNRPAEWADTWVELGRVAFAYMQGRPYNEIGALLLGREPETFDSNRTGGGGSLTPVFKFIGDVIDRRLALDAGCLLALVESWLEAEGGDAVPEELQGLPLCIRNGADRLNVLAWFRFGYRQRTCAHALNAAFPLPPGLVGDSERASAVRDLRRNWLRMRPDFDTPPALLDAARVVVLDGGSDRS